MSPRCVSFKLTSEEATSRCAADLGRRLNAGDTVLLSGPVGAGKTHFARNLIRSILVVPEDIPSPTFTLVQTYDTVAGPLWHADLYRVGSIHEIEELGLSEAFDTAICLIEWPDRLGTLRPESALDLRISPHQDPDSRNLKATWALPDWGPRLQGWAA